MYDRALIELDLIAIRQCSREATEHMDEHMNVKGRVRREVYCPTGLGYSEHKGTMNNG